MAIPCPQCGRDYDSTLFAFDRVIRCECGRLVSREGAFGTGGEGEAAAEELRRGADRIANLILHSDLPDVDIDIAIAALRRRCGELMPDRIHLFDWIYEARFRRLREQFPRK